MSKAKLPGPLPSPLFDSSGSAQVRFAGPKAHVEVHWAKFGAKIAQGKLVCAKEDPNDGMLIGNNNKNKATECKACMAGVQSKTRGAAIGWDVTANRWCLFMAAPSVFSDVFSKCAKHGVTPEAMLAGDGPNVVIQRAGMATIVEVVPESIGSRPQGSEKLPDLALVLAGMRKRSLWTKYSTPDDIPCQDFLGSNTSSDPNLIGTSASVSYTTGCELIQPVPNSTWTISWPDNHPMPSPLSQGSYGSSEVFVAQNKAKLKKLLESIEDAPDSQPSQPPPDVDPKPSDKPKEEWMDGSSLIAKSRWEMID